LLGLGQCSASEALDWGESGATIDQISDDKHPDFNQSADTAHVSQARQVDLFINAIARVLATLIRL